ncbi:MAG: cytochrome c-type biogenesis protein CcmH [Gammaproteobacteria bacterium]|nr:cytochrome c-type biogenesis protein CcmH [Gammaproteobacteria bacterium]
MAILSKLNLLLLLVAVQVEASSSSEIMEFDSESDRNRYSKLISELRCPKCMNTNLAGSDAPISKDLKSKVYNLITQDGMTDEQIIAYMRERYGDFVLYDPPLDGAAMIIWLVPVGLVLLAISILGLAFTRIRAAKNSVLSEEKKTEMQALLDDV